jgi:hypothetical protein
MWASCFANSDYKALYKEYEQLADFLHWPISELRHLTYRERQHWVKRYIFKLEQDYDRMHQANNSTQVMMRSVGQEVTFGGIPYK